MERVNGGNRMLNDKDREVITYLQRRVEDISRKKQDALTCCFDLLFPDVMKQAPEVHWPMPK